MADVFFTGVREFNAALDKMIAAADVAARQIVTQGGHAVEAAAKAHMNGRPGPNVRSGDLRRSVTVTVAKDGLAAYRSETGPTVAYGRRIELGFHGADSRGRHYDQQPYPFMQPGFDDAGPVIDVIATTAWFGATRAGTV